MDELNLKSHMGLVGVSGMVFFFVACVQNGKGFKRKVNPWQGASP